MRYITKSIFIFFMSQTYTFASDNHFQPFGSAANSIATFHMTGGNATMLNQISAVTYTTSGCSSASATTFIWSGGSNWPVNTRPYFGLNKAAAYHAAAQYSQGAQRIKSIKISFSSNSGGTSSFSGAQDYCITNVSCSTSQQNCSRSPQLTNIAFTMN